MSSVERAGNLVDVICVRWMRSLTFIWMWVANFPEVFGLNLSPSLHLKNLLSGNSVISCLKNWCLNEEVKHIRSLPVIVLWFLWKARNQSCFEDFILMPSQVSSLSLGLLSSYPQDKIVVKIRYVVEAVIDKSFSWGILMDQQQVILNSVEMVVCFTL